MTYRFCQNMTKIRNLQFKSNNIITRPEISTTIAETQGQRVPWMTATFGFNMQYPLSSVIKTADGWTCVNPYRFFFNESPASPQNV